MKRVAELGGIELAFWVGRADGADFGPDCNQGGYIITGGHSGIPPEVYAPHKDWAQGGAIIERERIAIDPITRNRNHTAEWQAQVWVPFAVQTGPTPLIAAMRAFVAGKFGETVDEVAK